MHVTQSRYHVAQRRRLLTYINRRHYFHTHSRLDTLQHTQTTFTLSCVVTQSSTHSTSHSHTLCLHSLLTLTLCVSLHTTYSLVVILSMHQVHLCLSVSLFVCVSMSLSLSVCVCHKTLPRLHVICFTNVQSSVINVRPSVSCPVSSQSVTVTQQTDPLH